MYTAIAMLTNTASYQKQDTSFNLCVTSSFFLGSSKASHAQLAYTHVLDSLRMPLLEFNLVFLIIKRNKNMYVERRKNKLVYGTFTKVY